MNNNKHNEFVESLRSVMRNEEQKQRRNTGEYGEKSQSLQELLEVKFDELFGFTDD